jgi:hypothetical protein
MFSIMVKLADGHEVHIFSDGARMHLDIPKGLYDDDALSRVNQALTLALQYRRSTLAEIG